MDEDKKQKIMIGIVAGCLGLAVIITVVTNLGKGGGRGPTGPVTMLCINEQCNADFDLEVDEMREQLNQMTGGNDMMMMTTPVFICNECNQRSAYRAMICTQCDTMFVPVQNSDFRDRCPDCGYSRTEERRNAAN